MGEFYSFRYFDVPAKDEQFDEFYDHFFANKVAPTISRINLLVNECTEECALDYKDREACKKRCSLVRDEFVDHLSDKFSNRLSTFSSCMELCRPHKNTEECLDDCVIVTIQLLDNLDIEQEFNSFIDSGAWR